WVAAGALRAGWPSAFPWGRLAMSQAGAPTAPWAAIGGAPLLSFPLALVGSTLAWLLLVSGGPTRRRAVAALGFAGAAGLALAGGLLPVDPVPAGTPTATVAAIQGNVPHAQNLPDLLRATTVTSNQAAATERPALPVRPGTRPSPSRLRWPREPTR